MSDWPVKKLGEIVSFEYGKGLPAKKRVVGQYPVYGSNGQVGLHNKKLVAGPGVIVGRKGSIGEVVWSEKSFWPIDTTYYIKLKNGIELPYVFYLLDTLSLSSLNKASGVPGLNRNDAYNISVRIPPKQIQKKIVERLDTIRKTQELNDEMISKNKELFESTLQGLLKDNKWPEKELSEICDVRDGTHDSPKYQNQGIPLITSKNLKDGVIDFVNVNYISEIDHQKIIKRSFVQNGDILYGMIGTIGNPVVVNAKKEFSIKNVGLIKFPNKNINNRFIYYYLQSRPTERQVTRFSRGGTQKFVSLGNLRSLKINIPELTEQKRIVEKVDSIQKYKKLLLRHKDLLQELFDSVLYKSMKGGMD